MGKTILVVLALLMLLGTIASHVGAQSFTFSRVADNNTAVPEGTGKFLYFGGPAISGSNVAFQGAVSGEQWFGVYLFNGTTLGRVADINTPVPDGTDNFYDFYGSSICGSNVAFWGYSYSGQQGVYLFNGTTLGRVVDINTPIPDGTGNFTSFNGQAISGGSVVFAGYGSSGQQGVYLFNGTTLSRVADLNTPIPDGTGSFTWLGLGGISGGHMAFYGQGTGQIGIYLFNGSTLSKVADLNTPIPDGTGNFTGFNGPSISGGNIAFEGHSYSGQQQGVYLFNGTTLSKVADRNTPIPEGTGNFTFLDQSPSISGGNVVFYGDGSTGQKGVYLFNGTTLSRVADLNTSIPGGTGNFTYLFEAMINGSNVVFGGWGSSEQQGIYLASGQTQYIYVGQDGLCGCNGLCFTSIQDGIDSPKPFTIMQITQEKYGEKVIFDDPKVVTLQGGWDTTFTSCSSYTTIQGSITITNGTLTLENIVLR